MKTFVMVLGLVAITAAPALAQRGGNPAATPQLANAGGVLVMAQSAGAPRLEMAADTIQPQTNARDTSQGFGTDQAVRLVPSPGHTQWQFDPPPDLYLGGN